NGAVANALNLPAISAQDAPQLKLYLGLARALGLLIAQLGENAADTLDILYAGDVAKLNTKPLTCEIVAGVLASAMDGVNRVNAPAIASERGIRIVESNTGDAHPWSTAIT